MKTISTRFMLVALVVLVASLLAACTDTSPATTSQSSLPNGGQAMPSPTETPTPTPMPTPTPTPTIISVILPTATMAAPLFQKGEPADLANTQLELQQTVNVYLTAAVAPAAGVPVILPTAATNPNPVSQPTVATNPNPVQPTARTNPVSQPTAAPANPTKIPSRPGSPGSPVTASCSTSSDTKPGYNVANFYVSPSTSNDIFVDTYQNNIIVGLVVCNRNQSSAAFSSLGLQLNISGTLNPAAPDSVAQSYLAATGLSNSAGTFATSIAPNTAKIIYGAFSLRTTSGSSIVLLSTNPSGLDVPIA